MGLKGGVMSKWHRAAVQEQLATLGATWALPGCWTVPSPLEICTGGWRGELGGSDRFASVTADRARAAASTLVLGEGLMPRAASVVGTQS